MKSDAAQINLSTLKTVVEDSRLTAKVLKFHAERINAELKAAGADKYDLALPETHYLPYVIHQDEHIKGSVYGKYSEGRGVLLATDRRVLFLDKKPLFVNCREMSFGVIGGVSRTQIGPIGTVTLHTRLGDFKLRTFNQKNALNFADSIDEIFLRNNQMDNRLP